MKKIGAFPKVLLTLMLWLLGFMIVLQSGSVRAAHQEPNQQPETLVVMQVTNPNGEEARATVIVGGAFSIEDQNTGQTIVFFPEVSGTNQRNVSMKVFQGINPKPGLNAYLQGQISLEKIEQLDLPIGLRKNLQTEGSFSIEIVAIIKRFTDKKDKSAEISTDRGRDMITLVRAGGDCCVLCNGYIYCSNCSVSTECGCCHSNSCQC